MRAAEQLPGREVFPSKQSCLATKEFCFFPLETQAFLSKRTKEERRRQLDGAKAMAEMAASGGGTTFPGATAAAAVASASAVSEQDRKEHLEWNSWTTWQ